MEKNLSFQIFLRKNDKKALFFLIFLQKYVVQHRNQLQIMLCNCDFLLPSGIFGKDKIADLKLQEIEKNTHATSSLANKHLNIIQDSDDSAINNNSLLKH